MQASSPSSLNDAIARLWDRLVPDRLAQDAIDLTEVAKTLGVVDVLYKASRIHGYTTWNSRGATLVLAMARTEGRRRTTLAHECAHLLLNPAFQPDASIDDRSRRRASEMLGGDVTHLRDAVDRFGIERVCDRLAFELLLPRARVRDLDLESISTATGVQGLAARFRVSLALLANQANKAGLRVQLLRLTEAWDGVWIVIDTAGATTHWRVGEGVDLTTSRRLASLSNGAGPMAVELSPSARADVDMFSAIKHGGTVVAVRALPTQEER
jgi:Zn-dependent peptidase ImmA (M78 family)